MAQLSVGTQIPQILLKKISDSGMQDVDLQALCAGKRVVIFAVPGAFTPTCNNQHLPSFVNKASELKAKGVDLIACISVNDAFVMDAWGKLLNTADAVTMLADGNAEFTKAVGMELDATLFGMGTRSKRYAMIVEDGTIKHIAVEPTTGCTVSSAEGILAQL